VLLTVIKTLLSQLLPTGLPLAKSITLGSDSEATVMVAIPAEYGCHSEFTVITDKVGAVLIIILSGEQL
jgi:hypothetical protein